MYTDETLFNEAISKGELVQYLAGYPAYAITEKFADMPTDYSAIFNPIDKWIKAAPENGDVVVGAIISLANDPLYGWASIFHLTNLALLRKNQGIDLFSSSFLESIASALRGKKDSFKSLKKWNGKNFDDGVWEMVKVENRILSKRHNITVLPEEL